MGIKEYFEGEKKKNVIRYVYAVFRKEKEAETEKLKIKIRREEGYLDPCEVGSHIWEKINVYGMVVNMRDNQTTEKRNREMIICNGYGGCRLVFWEDVLTKSDNISEGDMVYTKNAYVTKREYGGLINVRINSDTEVEVK